MIRSENHSIADYAREQALSVLIQVLATEWPEIINIHSNNWFVIFIISSPLSVARMATPFLKRSNVEPLIFVALNFGVQVHKIILAPLILASVLSELRDCC